MPNFNWADALQAAFFADVTYKTRGEIKAAMAKQSG